MGEICSPGIREYNMSTPESLGIASWLVGLCFKEFLRRCNCLRLCVYLWYYSRSESCGMIWKEAIGE